VDTQYAKPGEAVLLVYNPSSWQCDENILVDVVMPQDASIGELQIFNTMGRVVPHQVLSILESNRLRQPRHDIPTLDRRRVYRITLQTLLPGYGFGSFRVGIASVPHRPTATLFTDASTMENRYMRVTVASDGTLTLQDKQTGRTYTGLLTFEDRGDGGEGWNWIPPLFDRTYLSTGAPFMVARVQDGALLATLRLSTTLRVPAGFIGDAHEYDPKRMQRDDQLVDLPIAADITLGVDSRQLEIDVTVKNTARNHRLRALFPTDIQTDRCYADGAFDVVLRAIHQVDSHDWREPQLGTYPHSSFVAVENEGGGMAVITSGTQEYEVMDESRRTVAITLLRAFGRGAGEPQEYIDSQELGSHTYRFALLPYTGNWELAGVVCASRQFNQKPLAVMTNGHPGTLPAGKSLLSIVGKGIDVTAVKHSEDRESLVIRLVNLSEVTQTVRISHVGRITGAHKLNLAEDRLQTLPVDQDGALSLTVAPRQIATVEIVPG
jgi:alpha-mannosidase